MQLTTSSARLLVILVRSAITSISSDLVMGGPLLPLATLRDRRRFASGTLAGDRTEEKPKLVTSFGFGAPHTRAPTQTDVGVDPFRGRLRRVYWSSDACQSKRRERAYVSGRACGHHAR